MVRWMFTVIAALLLVGLAPTRQVGAREPVTADHCCPGEGDADDAPDCCDFDLGACCAAGVVAAVPGTLRRSGGAWMAAPPGSRDDAVGPRAWRPRDVGPPPTPPPIAAAAS